MRWFRLKNRCFDDWSGEVRICGPNPRMVSLVGRTDQRNPHVRQFCAYGVLNDHYRLVRKCRIGMGSRQCCRRVSHVSLRHIK
jgi:hypothetical protein